MKKAVKREKAKKESKRIVGWHYYAGVGVIAASASLLAILKSCKSEPENIDCPTVQEINSQTSAEKNGKCEIDKGEHDPLSPKWSPEDCGYCGDGKVQEWETEDYCPADYACKKPRDEKPYSTIEIIKSPYSNYPRHVVKTAAEVCDNVKPAKVASAEPTGSAEATAEKPEEKADAKEEPKISTCQKEAEELAKKGPPPSWADGKCRKMFSKLCEMLDVEERKKFFTEMCE